MEWAFGEELRFLLSYTRQACRDTWFHPESFTGHPIDHLLCRPRDHRFLGSSKVLFEELLSEAWPAYTDQNPIEVRLVEGWVFRAPTSSHKKLRRPNWLALRGVGESATVARGALATEMDRRVALEPPASWKEVVDLGLGVARAVLGEEPKPDPRPWVRGCEPELRVFVQAVLQASSRKRSAGSWSEWREADYDVRRCKRRRGAWLREKEVQWWDVKAKMVQDQVDNIASSITLTTQTQRLAKRLYQGTPAALLQDLVTPLGSLVPRWWKLPSLPKWRQNNSQEQLFFVILCDLFLAKWRVFL